jgi:hypothetical protein
MSCLFSNLFNRGSVKVSHKQNTNSEKTEKGGPYYVTTMTPEEYYEWLDGETTPTEVRSNEMTPKINKKTISKPTHSTEKASKVKTMGSQPREYYCRGSCGSYLQELKRQKGVI